MIDKNDEFKYVRIIDNVTIEINVNIELLDQFKELIDCEKINLVIKSNVFYFNFKAIRKCIEEKIDSMYSAFIPGEVITRKRGAND
jgi:hypothetical protein